MCRLSEQRMEPITELAVRFPIPSIQLSGDTPEMEPWLLDSLLHKAPPCT